MDRDDIHKTQRYPPESQTGLNPSREVAGSREMTSRELLKGLLVLCTKLQVSAEIHASHAQEFQALLDALPSVLPHDAEMGLRRLVRSYDPTHY